MDFNSLLKGALPSLGGNMTAVLGHNSSRRSLPEGVAHLLPLLGSRSNPLVQMIIVAYDMLDNRLGLDPTVVLTAFGFLWAFNKVWRQVYGTASPVLPACHSPPFEIDRSDERVWPAPYRRGWPRRFMFSWQWPP